MGSSTLSSSAKGSSMRRMGAGFSSFLLASSLIADLAEPILVFAAPAAGTGPANTESNLLVSTVALPLAAAALARPGAGLLVAGSSSVKFVRAGLYPSVDLASTGTGRAGTGFAFTGAGAGIGFSIFAASASFVFETMSGALGAIGALAAAGEKAVAVAGIG